MDLTRKELFFLKNVLLASRAYRGMDIPHGVNLWEPWQEEFYRKVLDYEQQQN